jgi:hypothetical protein
LANVVLVYNFLGAILNHDRRSLSESLNGEDSADGNQSDAGFHKWLARSGL